MKTRTKKLFLSTGFAVGALVASAPEALAIDWIIKRPGSHPGKSVELEPHLNFILYRAGWGRNVYGRNFGNTEVGGGFRASIELADPMFIKSINNSIATQELGLDVAAVSGVINGTDVAPVESQGIFANLDALRNAMRNNDQAAMTRAAEKLDLDLQRVIANHGKVGAMVREFESRTEQMEDQNLATTSLLSSIQDIDFTEAVSRFQLLQTAMQATLQATAKSMSLSLMDFLG